MAYFTRSVAKPSGYYVALNSRCSADMYGHQNGTAVSLRCDDEDVFAVDRTVAQRHTGARREFLVLWNDYPKEDSSWVPERDITLPALQYFHDPQPEYRVISDAVSIFLSEVARSLKCGVNRACSFSFSFRTDAFKCLFGGKGKDCPHKLGYFYDEKDFDVAHFLSCWFVCYDRLGDGCKVNFPIRLYSKWLPVVYTKDECGTIVPKKRSFKEVCYISVSKVRC